MAYNNIIRPEATTDIGSAINQLIKQHIKNLNTAFLAKVESISEDGKKVNIIDLITKDEAVQNPIIPNVMIAQPYTGEWKLQFKVGAGDIGLAIVCKRDISNYKKSGEESVANTQRLFDITDSIFIPLSLFLQENNENLGFFIESKDGSNKISFDKDGNLNILSKGNMNIESKGAITLKSASPMQIGTSDTLLKCFEAIIDGVKNGIIGGITTGSPATQTINQLPMYDAQAQIMKTTIKKVLK